MTRDPNRTIAIALGVIGHLAGAAFIFFALWPLLQSQRSTTWTAQTCTVRHAEVYRASGKDGVDRYRIIVRYDYTVAGRNLSGERYDFAVLTDTDGAGKQRVVDQLKTQGQVPCWVDPNDPSEATLSRDYQIPAVPLLLGIVTLLGGIAALAWGLLKKR